MKRFIRPATALSAALVAVACTRPGPSGYSVVLVTLDTTRADRIGIFGGTAVPTPHLDAAAGEGLRFDSAISQVPLTLPSHASILTGRYPASHGVRHNGVFRLPDSERTLAERLKDAGFHTAAFIGAFVLNSPFGTGQGFDTYDEIPAGRYDGGQDNLYEAQRTAEQVNAALFAWLDKRPAGRFFAWVHYYDPHLPYAPPEGRPLSGTGYDREISYVDSCFGDLVDRLKRDGLYDRVVLVVTGDHGESLGEHRELSHGVFLYDATLRVPLFLRAPGLLPRGKRVDETVELIDIVPTLLDVLGLPAAPEVQGRSLLHRVARPAFAETMMPRIDFGWSDLSMVRDGRFKYIQAPRPELYDLGSDPQETHNLLAVDAERASEMAQELAAWSGRTENSEAAEAARHTLSAEDEARLRSLGYLGGSGGAAAEASALADPKDRIDEALKLTRGRELLQAGQAEPALALLDEVVAANPQSHLGRSSRVQALLRLHRQQAAEEEAYAALAAASQDPTASPVLVEKAQRLLAAVLWMNGKGAEAERHYRAAIELNKTNQSAPAFPGILLGAAGGLAEASRIVDDVLSRSPRDPMALAARFELELARGQNEAALRTAAELAPLRAGDADTLVKAGRLARDAGQLPLAVALFAGADAKQPGDADILGYLGTARLQAGDIGGAQRALEASRRARPADPRAAFYLGNIALLRNDEQAARKLYGEALELDPHFTAPLHNLARWLAEKHRAAEARTVLEDAVRRRPDDAEARSLIAQLERR